MYQTKKNSIRLCFLEELIASSSYTIEEIANKLNVARQTMSRIFRVDDCAISTAEKIADILGYKIWFNFDVPLKNDKLIIKNETMPNKRLQGITELLRRKNENRETLANNLGVTSAAVNIMFQKDDAKISMLYRIADAENTKLIVHIREKS